MECGERCVERGDRKRGAWGVKCGKRSVECGEQCVERGEE